MEKKDNVVWWIWYSNDLRGQASWSKIREIDFTENNEKLNTIQASIEELKMAQQNIQNNFQRLQENLDEMQEQRKYDLVELKNMLQTHCTNL